MGCSRMVLSELGADLQQRCTSLERHCVPPRGRFRAAQLHRVCPQGRVWMRAVLALLAAAAWVSCLDASTPKLAQFSGDVRAAALRGALCDNF